jgi:hypothetical protein
MYETILNGSSFRAVPSKRSVARIVASDGKAVIPLHKVRRGWQLPLPRSLTSVQC